MKADPLVIYIIAGEPSGDMLGAALMAALHRQTQGRVRFAGIGGEAMQAQGLDKANTLHHINFMVTDIDDIGKAMNRLKAADVPIVFGPGRHLPSTSIFLYFLDPDGNTMEFSFGMELFGESDGRGPRELQHKPEVMDIWGGRPDPRFGKGSPIVVRHG